jgi:uncharacterized protein (TIGR02687 family)
MNIEQLEKGLSAKFERSRIVFWQDPDREFFDQISLLQLDQVCVIQLDTASHFEVKQRIELVKPTQQFLLYSTEPQPEVTRDWLFDIRLYSETFYADSSSMILNELGMRMEFRQLVGRYKKFFTSKQRLLKIKKLLPVNANEDELEQAMLAVVLKVDAPGFVPLVQQLMLTLSENLVATDVLDELDKFDLQPCFARLLEKEFGYIQPKNSDSNKDPVVALNMKDLLLKLLITDFYHGLISSGVDAGYSRLAQSLTNHLLPMVAPELDAEPHARQRFTYNSSKRAAVINFVSGWRESRVLNNSYNHLAEQVQQMLEVKNRLLEITDPKDGTVRVQPELLSQVETFDVVEQAIITMLAKQLPAFDSADVEALISKRLMGHWCFINPNYAAIYRAIRAAKQFYDLKLRYAEGFSYSSAKDFYAAYQQELYQFDACYRVFCENAVNVAQSGSDILKLTGLVDDIEGLYVDWYLHDMAVAWGRLVDQENLLTKWNLAGVQNQYQFYRHHVRQVLDTTQNKRVFVIISDALRYEVAQELTQQINEEKRFKADITSQLGVVPSYTQLGMAALLPHEQMTAHLGIRTEFKADGISVHGLENRQKILARHNGLAFKAKEVLDWTNQEGRDKVKDAEVIYIYHDEIDATGDTAATENQTFQACRDAINELNNLISRIINRLNGSRVVITADHGFLFKMTDVTDTDKTKLKAKPNGTVEAKKRYVTGSNLPRDDYFWTGKMAATANIDVTAGDDAEFIVPRGSNRFNFVGGAKFIHGGVMPQEICVPVIHVRVLDAKAQTKHAKQVVGVVPLHSPIKLVSNIDRIQLLQTEAVGDKFKARELSLWVEDSDGKVVSSKEKLLFDSTSDKMDERKKSVQIALSGTGFSRSAQYKLVMLDTENNLKYNSFSVTIDLAFEDDFF